MPVPGGHTVFSWTRVQSGRLVNGTERIRIFYEEWDNLTTAQKNGIKAQALSGIDDVVTELADIRAAINAL